MNDDELKGFDKTREELDTQAREMLRAALNEYQGNR